MYRNPQCDSDTGILRNQDTDPGGGMPPCFQGPGPQDATVSQVSGRRGESLLPPLLSVFVSSLEGGMF